MVVSQPYASSEYAQDCIVFVISHHLFPKKEHPAWKTTRGVLKMRCCSGLLAPRDHELLPEAEEAAGTPVVRVEPEAIPVVYDAEDARVLVGSGERLHRDDERLVPRLVLVDETERRTDLCGTEIEAELHDATTDEVELYRLVEAELFDRNHDELEIGRGLAERSLLEDVLGPLGDVRTEERVVRVIGLMDAEFHGRERSTDCEHCRILLFVVVY